MAPTVRHVLMEHVTNVKMVIMAETVGNHVMGLALGKYVIVQANVPTDVIWLL